MATDIREPVAVPAGPTEHEKRAALEQVLQSAAFMRADQLRAFLRYVCEMEMAGRGDKLSEYLIGVEALGRPNGYSPGEDPVVRRRAVHLREKLEEVYAGELANAPLRIELPKGRYVPRVVRAAPAALRAIPVDEPAPPAVAPARAGYGRRHLALAFLAGAAAAFLLPSLWVRVPSSVREHPFESGTSYEAEAPENQLTGKAMAVLGCASCSGRGRVRSIGAGPRNAIEMTRVQVVQGGEKELVIHYLLDGQRSFFVSVNGGPGVEVPLAAQSWAMPSQTTVKVRLASGPNTIRFYNDVSYAPDLDRIVVRD